MKVYWLTFRIADDANYAKRYAAVVDAVHDMARTWWVESTSFFVFLSALDIDSVATTVKRAMNPAKDLALLGMPEFMDARAIGAIQDQDLFKLLPFTKKA